MNFANFTTHTHVCPLLRVSRQRHQNAKRQAMPRRSPILSPRELRLIVAEMLG